MAIHVEVKAYENEAPERLVKRFLKKCKKDNLHQLFMDKYPGSARYEKPSDREKREKRMQTWRHKKRAEEEKEKEKKLG